MHSLLIILGYYHAFHTVHINLETEISRTMYFHWLLIFYSLHMVIMRMTIDMISDPSQVTLSKFFLHLKWLPSPDSEFLSGMKHLPSPGVQLQLGSVTLSYLTLCDPMDCTIPGFPIHHQLPELAQRTYNLFVSIICFPTVKYKSCESNFLPCHVPSHKSTDWHIVKD